MAFIHQQAGKHSSAALSAFLSGGGGSTRSSLHGHWDFRVVSDAASLRRDSHLCAFASSGDPMRPSSQKAKPLLPWLPWRRCLGPSLSCRAEKKAGGRGEPRLFLGLLERTDFNPALAACLAQTPKPSSGLERPHSSLCQMTPLGRKLQETMLTVRSARSFGVQPKGARNARRLRLGDHQKLTSEAGEHSELRRKTKTKTESTSRFSCGSSFLARAETRQDYKC